MTGTGAPAKLRMCPLDEQAAGIIEIVGIRGERSRRRIEQEAGLLKARQERMKAETGQRLVKPIMLALQLIKAGAGIDRLS